MNNDEFYAAMASQYNFVGIGARMIPIKDTDQAFIITVFPDGSAA